MKYTLKGSWTVRHSGSSHQGGAVGWLDGNDRKVNSEQLLPTHVVIYYTRNGLTCEGRGRSSMKQKWASHSLLTKLLLSVQLTYSLG